MEKVIVVIPVYNEAHHIGNVLDALSGHSYEVLLVDDGSSDDLEEAVKKYQKVRVIHHTINLGAGAATQTGIEAALYLGATIIVTMDGDGQHHPKDIERLLAPIRSGKAEVVIGSRFKGKNRIPLLRRFYNAIGNVITWLLSGLYLSDTQSGCKAFTRRVAEKIKISSNGFEFASEMIREIAWHNFRYTEVPITVTYSKTTMAKGQSFAEGIETVVRLVIRSLLK